MAKRSRKSRVPNQAGKGLINADGRRLKPQVSKVIIAVPVNDMCSSWFAYDLARLTAFSAAVIPNLQMHLYFHGGTYLGKQREELAEAAVAQGATHVLWIDSDMRFPKEALMGMLAQNKPIVATNYTRRRAPHFPVAWANNNYVWTHDDSEGLEPVDHTGFGLALIETRVFTDIPQPWFTIGYDPVTGEYTGEDVSFFSKARLAGYEVLVDHELSRYVQHTGTMEFTYLHALDSRELIKRVAEDQRRGDGTDHELRDAADGNLELVE